MGFPEDDILEMFKKSPPVFAVLQRKLKKVKEVLLATGKYDLLCIVKDPASLLCSIEKKIKPRMLVLGILDTRNFVKKLPSLAAITRMPECKFLEKFVHPYLNEVGEAYMANSALNSKSIIYLKEMGFKWYLSMLLFKQSPYQARIKEDCGTLMGSMKLFEIYPYMNFIKHLE